MEKHLCLRIENSRASATLWSALGSEGSQQKRPRESAPLGGSHKVVANILGKMGKPKQKRPGNGPDFPNVNLWVALGFLTHNLQLILFVFYLFS